MTSVDLTKMCLEWIRSEQPDTRGILKVYFNNIDIYIEKQPQWIATVKSQKGPVRKATVKFDRSMNEILSELEISKESKTVTDVTLTSGIVKGLDKKILLNPPPNISELFAKGIPVKVGQTRTEITVPKPPISQRQDFVPTMRGATATATATITSKESCYKGRFECTLSLNGEAIFSDGNQQDIKEIIRDFQSSERHSFFILPSTGRPYWSVTGEIELHWDEEDTIDWA